MEGTLDTIERDGRFRVGIAALSAGDRTRAQRFVSRLEASTGARAEVVDASLERLIGRLEDGQIDLLIAEFRKDTPWAKSVAIAEPLATRTVGGHAIELAPAARNGENRWVALVEREVRDGVGGGA